MDERGASFFKCFPLLRIFCTVQHSYTVCTGHSRTENAWNCRFHKFWAWGFVSCTNMHNKMTRRKICIADVSPSHLRRSLCLRWTEELSLRRECWAQRHTICQLFLPEKKAQEKAVYAIGKYFGVSISTYRNFEFTRQRRDLRQLLNRLGFLPCQSTWAAHQGS